VSFKAFYYHSTIAFLNKGKYFYSQFWGIKTMDVNFRPKLKPYWELNLELNRIPKKFNLVLKDNPEKGHPLEEYEYEVIKRYFNGTNTVRDIQRICGQKENGSIAPERIETLCMYLIDKQVLDNHLEQSSRNSSPFTLGLRDGLEWIPLSNNFYYLRNPFDVKYMKVSEETMNALLKFGRATYAEICDEFGWEEKCIKQLEDELGKLKMLGSVVIEGEESKFSHASSWNRIPFWNPDQWLEQRIKSIRFIWSKQSILLIAALLCFTFAVSLSYKESLSENTLEILGSLSIFDITQFIVYSFSVIAIHELGHGFTLKSYGMKVPTMGLMIGLMPGIYTDTSDATGLRKPAQRVWVMAAGIICQAILWAIGFWIWVIAQDGTWLANSAYIFMSASTFSLVINLNPLTKLDGYYLLAAASDVEDLKKRSFSFYRNLLSKGEGEEREDKILLLLAYTPLSFAYTFYVLGRLFLFLGNSAIAKVPTSALIFVATIFAFSLFNKGMENIPVFNISSSKNKLRKYEFNQIKTLTLKIPVYVRQPAKALLELIKPVSKPAIFLLFLYFIGNLSLSTSVTGEAIIASSKGSRRIISMPRDGRIEYVADPDNIIRAGDVILRVSLKEIDEEIENLKLEKEQAETKVNSLKNRIESTQNNLSYLESTLQSYERLLAQGVFSMQSVRETTLQLQNAILQIEDFKQQQISAESSVMTLNGKLSRLEADKQELTVLSPIDGTLILQDSDRLEGATLPRGEQVFEIVDLAKLTANVSVRQVYSDLVKVGSTAVFRPMNLASKEYSAEVISVPSFMDTTDEISKGTSLLVPILIKNDGKLRINETGYASIEVEPLKLYQMAFRELADVLPIQRIKPIFLGL